MKSLLLFGAGQVGALFCRMIRGEYHVLGFLDNDERRWANPLLGFPVYPPQAVLEFQPDCCCICVKGEMRRMEMEQQLRTIGYRGEILNLSALELLDLRTGTMRMLAEQILQLSVPGDVAELGVYQGDFAQLLNAAFPEHRLHLFDTFTGFDVRDVDAEVENAFSQAKAEEFSDTSAETVLKKLSHPEKAVFHIGYFPDSFDNCENLRFCFVSIDADLYKPTAAALPLFWDRLSPGGILMIHDANGSQYAGVSRALAEFCEARSLYTFPLCDLHGTVVLRKAV